MGEHTEEFEQGRQLGRIQVISELQLAAISLLSEPGENAEYDRAIIELVSDVLHIPHADRKVTEAVLRSEQAVKAKLAQADV